MIEQFDKKYLDVEFDAQEGFYTGSIIPPNAEEICASMPAYEDVVPPLSMKEIKEACDAMDANKTGNEWYVTRIFNQTNEGSCVGNAGTQKMEVKQAKQYGIENVVPLSAISVYQLIGRSPGSGAMVSDCLTALKNPGVIPLDTQANRERFGNVVMPHTGFYTKRPAGWEAVAANFQADETYVVRTVEGLLTAGVLGDGAVVGRSGHSIWYARPTFKSINDYYYTYTQSWGKWGFGAGRFNYGFGADSKRMIQSSAGWAFVVRTTVTPTWIAA